MAEYNCPHLCGGILFDLFLETRKPRKKVRDRQLSGTDNLSDVDVYKGFAYVITGENMQDYSGGAIRKCVSQYKCCESSKGSYVPFTDHAVRSAFVSATVTDKISVYRRLVEFKDKYLSDSKCEWLIRAIVDIIQNDCCIDAEQAFEVKADCFISKEKLNETQEVNFAVFIGSVLSYVIENCPDCESGKETFKEWYTRKNTRAEWKFCSDIGKTLKPISVDFEIRTKKKEHSATVKSDTSCEHIVEMPIEDESDEETTMEAQRFCLKYEEEMSLLPLCQIAYDVNPLHRDVRPMYTDYKLCSSKVKRKIMELKEIPILDFSDKGWQRKCIDKYNKQIHADGLTTREFLYEGAKYFHRAFDRYSNYEIEEFDPLIFERPFKGGKFAGLLSKSNLTFLAYYIIDFYWYKDEDPDHYVEPPMDYLWKLCDLGVCPEYEMTFWVCKFIITSSFQMVEDGFPIDEKWQNVFINDELIRTQEDMYYYALLQLYWLYMIERTTEEKV